MWSQDVIPWVTIATGQQYNRLRADALLSSYFLVHETDPVTSSVIVEGGFFYDASGQIILANTTTLTSIVPPSWNDRVDLITISETGVVTRTQGTEAASPTAPTVPLGHFVVAELYLRPWMTLINQYDQSDSNGYIIDRRANFNLTQLTTANFTNGLEIVGTDIGLWWSLIQNTNINLNGRYIELVGSSRKVRISSSNGVRVTDVSSGRNSSIYGNELRFSRPWAAYIMNNTSNGYIIVRTTSPWGASNNIAFDPNGGINIGSFSAIGNDIMGNLPKLKVNNGGIVVNAPSADRQTLLLFDLERQWWFFQKGVGASTALDLLCLHGNKYFGIGNYVGGLRELPFRAYISTGTHNILIWEPSLNTKNTKFSVGLNQWDVSNDADLWGSFWLAIKTVSGNYVVSNKDVTVKFWTALWADATCTLPDAALRPRRVVVIHNQSENHKVTVLATTGQVENENSLVLGNECIILQASGSNWTMLSQWKREDLRYSLADAIYKTPEHTITEIEVSGGKNYNLDSWPQDVPQTVTGSMKKLCEGIYYGAFNGGQTWDVTIDNGVLLNGKKSVKIESYTSTGSTSQIQLHSHGKGSSTAKPDKVGRLVKVKPNSTYKFFGRYQTSELAWGDGFQWKLATFDMNGSIQNANKYSSPYVLSPGNQQAQYFEYEFSTTATEHFVNWMFRIENATGVVWIADWGISEVEKTTNDDLDDIQKGVKGITLTWDNALTYYANTEGSLSAIGGSLWRAQQFVSRTGYLYSTKLKFTKNGSPTASGTARLYRDDGNNKIGEPIKISDGAVKTASVNPAYISGTQEIELIWWVSWLNPNEKIWVVLEEPAEWNASNNVRFHYQSGWPYSFLYASWTSEANIKAATWQNNISMWLKVYEQRNIQGFYARVNNKEISHVTPDILWFPWHTVFDFENYKIAEPDMLRSRFTGKFEGAYNTTEMRMNNLAQQIAHSVGNMDLTDGSTRNMLEPMSIYAENWFIRKIDMGVFVTDMDIEVTLVNTGWAQAIGFSISYDWTNWTKVADRIEWARWVVPLKGINAKTFYISMHKSSENLTGRVTGLKYSYYFNSAFFEDLLIYPTNKLVYEQFTYMFQQDVNNVHYRETKYGFPALQFDYGASDLQGDYYYLPFRPNGTFSVNINGSVYSFTSDGDSASFSGDSIVEVDYFETPINNEYEFWTLNNKELYEDYPWGNTIEVALLNKKQGMLYDVRDIKKDIQDLKKKELESKEWLIITTLDTIIEENHKVYIWDNTSNSITFILPEPTSDNIWDEYIIKKKVATWLHQITLAWSVDRSWDYTTVGDEKTALRVRSIGETRILV